MSRSRPQRGPSQRQLRVGENVRHVLASIIAEGHIRDPILKGVSITVAEARMTPDLRQAMVFVLPLGGKNADAVVEALNRNKSFLRGALGRSIDLRYTPDLVFRRDRSFEEAEHMNALLRSSALTDPTTSRKDEDQ